MNMALVFYSLQYCFVFLAPSPYKTLLTILIYYVLNLRQKFSKDIDMESDIVGG